MHAALPGDVITRLPCQGSPVTQPQQIMPETLSHWPTTGIYMYLVFSLSQQRARSSEELSALIQGDLGHLANGWHIGWHIDSRLRAALVLKATDCHMLQWKFDLTP